MFGGLITCESQDSNEESEYSYDSDDSSYSTMPQLVPRSDSFLDSDNGSADKNYFTFQYDGSSIGESDSSNDDDSDDDDESIYSATAAAVIRNIEEIGSLC